jgi:hypothetical protein
MQHNQRAVARLAQVDLYAIYADLNGLLERGNRVLRRGRAVAPVSLNKRS